MEAIKFDWSNLHNEEWYRGGTDFGSLAETFTPAALKITSLYERYVPLMQKADIHLLILRKSVYTSQMKTADKKRKTFFSGLAKTVKAALNHPAEAEKTAAEHLDNLLSQYKLYGIKGGYAEESGGIHNLLQDLTSAPYAADVTLLALTPWVVGLTQAEEEFNALREQRVDETANKPQEPLRLIRRDADKIRSNMIAVIEAQLVADGLGGNVVVDANDLKTGPYEESVPEEQRGNVGYNFIIKWNVYAKYYRDLLAARAGRSANKKDPEPSEPSYPVED
jgi:hypothetical protein